MNVGEGISLENKFDFKNGVAEGFSKHVRCSVPLYTTIHQMIIDMTEHFINYSDYFSTCCFLDIGCSSGELTRGVLNKYGDSVRVYGADYSKEMIDLAKELEVSKRVVYKQMGVTNEKINRLVPKCDVISMVLTMQFMPIEKRQTVVNEIYNNLKKGGAFMLVEKVIDSNTEINNMYVQQYHNFKEDNGLTAQNIVDKDKSLVGVMRPLTIQDNMNLLRRAGFNTMSVFFTYYNFIGIIATKEEV